MCTWSDSSLRQLAKAWHQAGQRAILITVTGCKGSTPRDAGTRMLVSPDKIEGTIGGGHLEWQAIELARQALTECLDGENRQPASWTQTFALGPSLGQCCGGVVTLDFSALNEQALQQWPLAHNMHIELHGAGHVGQALIKLLTDLDFSVRWIDTRDSGTELCGVPDADSLATLPPHITWHPCDTPEDEVADAPPGAVHLVMTHRHDLDLRIIEAILRRKDSLFAGMIGSQTKKAKFLHRLNARGLSPAQLAHMSCPIGLPELMGKAPAVIAVSVVAQLLLLRQSHIGALPDMPDKAKP